ncbi:MAG: ABC transporter substrate-binding protein, partial [Pseudomonadota bacterium]
MKMCTLALVVLLAALILPACNGSDDSTQTKRQDLVVCLAKSPLNLDPRYNTDAASFRITQVLFNGLVKKGPDMTLLPDLAERCELVNDVTWVFHLRRGVKFHNGREMKAADVAYTFQSILDPEYKSPKRQSFVQVESIEVKDDFTVIFHTREPFAPLLVNLTLGIVPAQEAQAAGEDFAAHPVGTGPFKFVSQEADQKVDLAAFDDYFLGKPGVRALTYRIIQDDTTRYLELIKGNLDFVQNAITSDMVPVVENKKEFQVVKNQGTNYEYLAFNFKDPILKNRNVRAAIAHALNIPEMITSLLRGLAVPATGLLPPDHWAYEPDVPRYPFDPALANRLLDEAGYPRQQDGFRFALTYKTSLSDQARLKAEIIQQELKEVGIKLDIRGYDWGTLFSDIKVGNFQIYSLQWVGISEPDIFYYCFHSDSVPPAGANRGLYLNPNLDALIEAGRRTMDNGQRKSIYSEIQKIVARDLPYVSLWYPTNVVIMKEGLRGFTPYPDGDLSDLWKVSWK